MHGLNTCSLYVNHGSYAQGLTDVGHVEEHMQALFDILLFSNQMLGLKTCSLYVIHRSYAQGLTDVGHVEERMQALFDNLQKRMEKRRTLGSLVLSIPGSSSIGLQLFKLTVALAAPKSVYVHAQTNELVVPKTRHELATTGTHIAPSLEQQHQRQKEYKKVFRSVDKKNPERAIQAIFSSEEVVHELRGLFGQGIELLGFKPLSKLEDYHNNRSAPALEGVDIRLGLPEVLIVSEERPESFAM
ncbi:hypothetical protein DUNSADRAFT_14076 [Dunaliella salina]|uniref:Ku domain-containing protein n=1 Tax=Dunaliella salina TaxID=3046 RepID=A0ABQ7G820_DUNSA|nr:hypothetical protein DUNSADRAFT_14076 [Dunaliella salina]|eukprot:KAF5830756.1 hypothetical protein DUNSADRAFT_14076 [Dunaliella salina]